MPGPCYTRYSEQGINREEQFARDKVTALAQKRFSPWPVPFACNNYETVAGDGENNFIHTEQLHPIFALIFNKGGYQHYFARATCTRFRPWSLAT